MRRQVTVGGLVALALLTGSVVAYAAQPTPPGECAPAAAAGAEGASPGLVPSPRAAGQDEPDPDDSDGDDPDPDDGGDPGEDQVDDSDDGAGDHDPAGDDPADHDPADEDPADDSDDGSDDGSDDDGSGDDSAGDDPAADDAPMAGDDGTGEEETGDSAGVDAPADATTPGAAPGEDPADPPAAPIDDPAADEPAGDAPTTDNCASPTAAEALGWGEPTAADEFDAPLGGDWRVYSGSGFDGQGTRTADALTVDDGVLTITGDEAGATGGMAWATGQEYGRWEARVRTPESDPSYNALLLLWPDDPAAAGGEIGSGEIDFMEMLDPTRQTANAFVHPGAEAAPAMGEVAVDGTAWHTWAVEWTPTAVTTYLDGVQWWTVDDPAQLPSGPMHLCVQLDWFPTGDGEVRESSMQVDWVRQYTLDAAPTAPSDDAAPAAGADPAAEPDPVAPDPATSAEAPSTDRLSEGAPDAPARPGLVSSPARAG